MKRQQQSKYPSSSGPKFEELSDDDDDQDHHSSNSSVRYEDPDDHHHHSQPSHTTANNRQYHSNPRSSRSGTRDRDTSTHHRDDPFAMTSFFNDPFFSNPFGSMSSMMKKSEEMFKSMHHDFDHHFSNSGGGSGNTMCYSSTVTSTSCNGVTKTKKTVKDSRTGTEKVSVIKQVGDKKSVMEKTRDRDGREHVLKRLENVAENEDFEKEWKQRSRDLPTFHKSRSGFELDSSSSSIASTPKRTQPKALNYEHSRRK